LNHKYDEARIRKEFKISPVKIDGVRGYESCPICDAKNVPISHVKEHSYTENITIADYIDRFPSASLGGSVRSLQEPLTTSDDGNVLTYEDVYQSTMVDETSETEMSLFSSHIDDILKNDKFTADILKLKMLDYKDSEIARELGDAYTFEVEVSVSKDIKKKSQIYEYVQDNMGNLEYFQKHNKFHVVSRKMSGDKEVFNISSCAPSQVNCAIKKLRNDKQKIKDLFGEFVVPNV
jgi:hypothetical protein